MPSVLDALLESAGSVPEAVNTDLKPELPKTKGAVGKLSSEQMDALVEAHGLAMPGEWAEGSASEKHKMLNVALGFVASKAKKGAKLDVVVGADTTPLTAIEDALDPQPNPNNLAILEGDDDNAPSLDNIFAHALKEKAEKKPLVVAAEDDPLAKVAQEIEGLTDQLAIEGEITTLLTSEGMNDFRLGGLMLKLLEVGTFPDNSTFKAYIEQRWGIKYRKARYLIELYNGLLKSGVPWETVAGIGWSKVITLLPVLTPDNAEEWVAKAKQYNNDTLQATVKAALASDGGGANPNDEKLEQSKLKTLTFGVGPDQEELIKEAVEHAMKVGQTEHKGVALELICTEYLGNTSGIAPQKNKKAEPAYKLEDTAATITVEEHEAALAAAYDPDLIFSYFLKKANGNVTEALGALFGGDAFDKAFPTVTISIDIGG